MSSAFVRPLLLDFGGVVLKTPFELRHIASPTLGPMQWNGPFDPETDPEWVRYQDGFITERQFWAARAEEYGRDTRTFMHAFYEPSGDHLVRTEMISLIDEHKSRGGIVGVLTNDMQAFHGKVWMDGISVISEFDFLIDGSITGVLKPDPRAFTFAMEALSALDRNVEPSDVLFVDDQRVNFSGAVEVGIEPIWFDPTDVPYSIERINTALSRASEHRRSDHRSV